MPHRRRGGRVMQTRLYLYAAGVWQGLAVWAILNGVFRKAYEPVPVEEA